MENKQQAIILGATGLVGSALLKQLLVNSNFDKITLITRRSAQINHPKIIEHIVDFDKPDTWKEWVKGDVLFSAFGTTIKKAKSKENQYKIDFTYQYYTAKAAAANGVSKYILISSAGANAHSKIFYSQMKGALDEVVSTLNFKSLTLIKPSVLNGIRKESRLGETIGIKLGNLLCKLPFLKKYRPIKVEVVAQAMIAAALDNTVGKSTYELSEVFTKAQSI